MKMNNSQFQKLCGRSFRPPHEQTTSFRFLIGTSGMQRLFNRCCVYVLYLSFYRYKYGCIFPIVIVDTSVENRSQKNSYVLLLVVSSYTRRRKQKRD